METLVKNLLEEAPPFIIANTVSSTLDELRNEHIIPVFAKDNHPLVAQSQLVELMGDVLEGFNDFKIEAPQIRVSHPIMGRIPDARFKKAIDLLQHEKTIYFERMMFLFRIPNIRSTIEGQELSLVVGGIKSYAWDNLGKDQRTSQSFKFFIGFQVKVCSNLCVWSDGVVLQFKASSISQIGLEIRSMIERYNADKQLEWMGSLPNYSLTEPQFAHFIGKCRMYSHLPDKKDIPEILITDSQINSVVKGYYTDPNFGKVDNEINLWNLYNLITESNKSTYIDQIIDRGNNSNQIIKALVDREPWFTS